MNLSKRTIARLAAGKPHGELVAIAEQWLRRRCVVGMPNSDKTMRARCGIAASELVTSAQETPDAIGWWNSYSVLVECKVSRADFLRDKYKIFRHPDKGVGMYRYYACPETVIQLADLPDGWGLLHLYDVQLNVVKPAMPRYVFDQRSEIRILLSIVRRLKSGGAA